MKTKAKATERGTELVSIVKPYVVHERRMSAFTAGELWAVVPENTDQLALLFGEVTKSYMGYVKVENMPKLDYGLMELKPDGTVWMKHALKNYKGDFIYRVADPCVQQVGTWTMEIFDKANEDNEFGCLKIESNGKTVQMMAKRTIRNNTVRFQLKAPYESDEIAAKYNKERAEREARTAEAKHFVQVNIL